MQRLRGAAGRGPGQRRRLQADGGGPGDVDFDALQAQADNLAAKGNQQPGLVGLFNGFRADTPQLYVDIDRDKVKTMGVALTDVFDTLQAYLGSYYVNDFNRFGRTWQVNVQADAAVPHRRGDDQAAQGPQRRRRHGAAGRGGRGARRRRARSRSPATTCSRRPRSTARRCPAISTGDVLGDDGAAGDEELPRNMTTEWTELSYLQKQAASRAVGPAQPVSAFVLGVVLVFFVLAGLYESWSLPLAVILVVPMCLLEPLAGIALAGMDVNIFVQVGFVVLVGLAGKNAILIVEFARDRQRGGRRRVRRRRGGAPGCGCGRS